MHFALFHSLFIVDDSVFLVLCVLPVRAAFDAARPENAPLAGELGAASIV